MDLDEILSHTRALIREYAGKDPDKWFYANRFVYARLQLDERAAKPAIKKKLLASTPFCYVCGEAVESKGTDVHRIDAGRGYTLENCALLHPKCHQELSRRESRLRKRQPGRSRHVEGANHPERLSKSSKRYDDKRFLYWWDITPNDAASFKQDDVIDFVKKDSGEFCSVPAEALRRHLTPGRRTSRGAGNWGIRILPERADAIAFEAGKSDKEPIFLPVTWNKASA